MSKKITVCIFGAEHARREEIIAAVLDKIDIVSTSGRAVLNISPIQEIEKETGQIQLFLSKTLKDNKSKLSDIPSIKKGLEEIKEIASRINEKTLKSNISENYWSPKKGEPVACYQEGDRVYKVLPFHTTTKGKFYPTERYYDHIRRYDGQRSLYVIALRDAPEYGN